MLVDELEIDFAYPHAYPEQLEYMRELKDALTTADQTALLELPSFLGRTTATLALLTSVLRSERSEFRKVVICTRTMPEVERVLEELRLLEAHRSKSSGPSGLVAAGLPSSKLVDDAAKAVNGQGAEPRDGDFALLLPGAVSYTHLTLPTICSV